MPLNRTGRDYERNQQSSPESSTVPMQNITISTKRHWCAGC